MSRSTWQVALAACVLIVFVSPSQGDWLRFRGPNGSGVSDDAVRTESSAHGSGSSSRRVFCQNRLIAPATAESEARVALNKVTSDAENFSGTPAISHGALFIRSNKHLNCVASE